MKKISNILAAGIAIFAILFGSGNIVFPLLLGRDTANQVWWAIAGLFITAVFVPILGLVSTALVDGDSNRLLGLLGKPCAMVITFVSLLLIGPFGVIPRCITIAYSAAQWYIPALSLMVFSIGSSLILFLFTYKKSSVIDIIGRFLGPIKLTLLLSIIVFGLYWALPLPASNLTGLQAAGQGIIQGLWMLDLLATIFFAGLILNNLQKHITVANSRELAWIALQAGSIGALLLGIVYVGFCIVAAMYGPQLHNVASSQILTALAALILGPQAGILANITIAVACLTTAIALTTIFTNYLHSTILSGKTSYSFALLITIFITTLMAHMGFATIMTLIIPVINALYPALIVLAIINILKQLYGFKWVKTPVALTFILTISIIYWDLVMSCVAG